MFGRRLPGRTGDFKRVFGAKKNKRFEQTDQHLGRAEKKPGWTPSAVTTTFWKSKRCRKLRGVQHRGKQVPAGDPHPEDEHHAIEPASDADMLRHLMEAKGVSQMQLSHDTGLPKSTISEVLARKKTFSRQMIRKLAEYFHVDVSVLAANI